MLWSGHICFHFSVAYLEGEAVRRKQLFIHTSTHGCSYCDMNTIVHRNPYDRYFLLIATLLFVLMCYALEIAVFINKCICVYLEF